MATTAQFTTTRTADLLDHLCEAIDIARAASAGNTRWLNAINAAWDHLLTVDTIEYRANDHALIYHSESGKTYTANGRCQCEAYRNGNACKHRAAARIVFRGLELRAMAEAHDLAVEAEERRAAERYYGEIDALAAELHADAQAAGDVWYDRDIAQGAAQDRYAGLMSFAAEWDLHAQMVRDAVAEGRAHLAAVA